MNLVKKIVIVTNKMVVGGIEKALIEMLGVLSKKYEVTLVLNSKGGELFDRIPTNVKIVYMQDQKVSKNIITKFISMIKRTFYKISLRFVNNYAKECEILTKIYPKSSTNYNLAIAYSSPVSLSNYYVINNINAEKKVMFLHNDVKEINISPIYSKNLYDCFDKIFAVSENCKNSFIKFFPNLEQKTDVMYNLINIEEINFLAKQKLNETWKKNDNEIHLCTVGRLEYEKGQDIIPSILVKFKNIDRRIKWHLVGDGSLKNQIVKEAEEKNVLDMIVFEGYQENPYPYIQNCDIYVQTSRQEGFGITLTEAKILKKVIVSTNFLCAYEQIANNENGLIVGFDADSLSNAIINLFQNDNLKNKFIRNLNDFKYANDISKLEELL